MADSYDPLVNFKIFKRVMTLKGDIYALATLEKLIVLVRFENLEKSSLNEFSTMYVLPSLQRLENAGIEVPDADIFALYSQKFAVGPRAVLGILTEISS
jgi:hypothetical protein